MRRTWLAVDSGNTVVKWAKMDGIQMCSHDQSPKAKLTSLAVVARPIRDIWVSHVGSEDDRQHLSRVLTTAGQRIKFLRSRRHLAGLHNHYQPPTTLGIDRWLCLLALHPVKRSTIIVSAGTAVTVDLLPTEGIFRGGIILPGLHLMASALASATPLPMSSTITPPSMPKNTDEAIATGTILAIVGAIKQYRRQYGSGAALSLTGGDAQRLLPWLPSAVHQPNLVLRGIARLREISR